MKNWQITGFLAILLVGILLMSGCTSAPPQKIVYVTVLVTPTPTVIPTQDPIIGVWIFQLGSIKGSTFKIKYTINADGTYSETGYVNSESFRTDYGTWVAQGNNMYLLHNLDIEKDTRMRYDPVNKTIKYAD